ncbi:MAG: XdhC family protein [Nitrososphaerota archaeon]|nr:XdhC/CoxI family protein [Nitrososphaerota archaeon]MDG6937026.1 XdhC family protein [Nitrososphaerota archaeon]MDG6961171.1 XdhC family protein [Nitrososphaerota archaeon]MDG6973193.1 XdhC family protein [Nitrososphaerota archaeon]MDG6981188.1 XdhC family protein [Nitrososphaerota archaeon]
MSQSELAKTMGALAEKGEPFVVATVVKAEGGSMGGPGSKAIVSGTGKVVCGGLGGFPESALASYAKKVMGAGAPRTVKVYLDAAEGSAGPAVRSQTEDEVHVEARVGGAMEVYFEPFLPAQRLVLVGQGGKDDVEDALVRLGKGLDFEVVVVDHSPVLSEEPDRLIGDPSFDLSKLDLSPSDSVVVLTKGERDVLVLQALSQFHPRYVALVASAKRAEEDRAALRKAGVAEAFVASLRSPAGADIGAVTPAEIALSIMAEAVAERYEKKLPAKARTSGGPAASARG